MDKPQILVIKHSAFGDIILATAGFAAIRARHPEAHIVCLTSPPYADMLRRSPFFDEIWTDSKPKWWHFLLVWRLARMLRSRRWEWVYDLQASTRSTLYQWLLKMPWPKICNVSRFTQYGYTDPVRHSLHALESIRRQLAAAGLEVGMPELSWMQEDVAGLQPGGRYALLVPGTSPKRIAERWPHYAGLADALVKQGITPVLVGTQIEAPALDAIAAQVPQAVNLCGKTSFFQLATLARGAVVAVGNNTGPMHLIGACNCPSVVIFNFVTNPALARPAGAAVSTLRVQDLAELSVAQVMDAVNRALAGHKDAAA